MTHRAREIRWRPGDDADVNRAGGWTREKILRNYVDAVKRAKGNEESDHDQRTRRAARRAH